jgi:FkbM family methyltransferase
MTSVANKNPTSFAVEGDDFQYMGLAFPVDEKIMSEKILSAIFKGYYEAEEAKHLPYILQKGERVLELGTGLGLISGLCAANQLVESVLTIEASPLLIDYIRRLHAKNKLNSKIEVRNAIAMPNPATPSMKFYRRADLWASSLDSGPWGFEEEIDVETVDLNKLIADFKPTLLIVDIEGGEKNLFEGSELGTVRKVMLEVHQNVIGRRGMKGLFDALSARDFHYDQWHSSHNVVTFSHVDRD